MGLERREPQQLRLMEEARWLSSQASVPRPWLDMGCAQACVRLGSSLCCFSLCSLSVILTPGKEELRQPQERGEARL